MGKELGRAKIDGIIILGSHNSDYKPGHVIIGITVKGVFYPEARAVVVGPSTRDAFIKHNADNDFELIRVLDEIAFFGDPQYYYEVLTD